MFFAEGISDQELPNDYIIPPEYYDRYRLVFSHYHLDRKLVRIGKNERQRQAKARGAATDSPGSHRTMDGTWNGIKISREENNFQGLTSVSSKNSQGQHLIN